MVGPFQCVKDNLKLRPMGKLLQNLNQIAKYNSGEYFTVTSK